MTDENMTDGLSYYKKKQMKQEKTAEELEAERMKAQAEEEANSADDEIEKLKKMIAETEAKKAEAAKQAEEAENKLREAQEKARAEQEKREAEAKAEEERKAKEAEEAAKKAEAEKKEAEKSAKEDPKNAKDKLEELKKDNGKHAKDVPPAPPIPIEPDDTKDADAVIGGIEEEFAKKFDPSDDAELEVSEVEIPPAPPITNTVKEDVIWTKPEKEDSRNDDLDVLEKLSNLEEQQDSEDGDYSYKVYDSYKDYEDKTKTPKEPKKTKTGDGLNPLSKLLYCLIGFLSGPVGIMLAYLIERKNGEKEVSDGVKWSVIGVVITLVIAIAFTLTFFNILNNAMSAATLLHGMGSSSFVPAEGVTVIS